MMILDIRILKGPNYWSVHHKVAEILIDLGKYEELPTDRIEGFYEALIRYFPGLYEQQATPGRSGGFLQNVREGTKLSQVFEHLAIEIQLVAGLKAGFGNTVSTKQRGVYKVVFAYEEERAAIYAANTSLRIIESMCEQQSDDLSPDLSALKKIAAEDRLGPGTAAIVMSAISKNIPVIRLDSGSLVQLGYGDEQKRIKATITDNTSSLAVELAGNKHKAKFLLREAGIDVPEGVLINHASELEKAIEQLGFPLVTKPNDANQGRGVTVNINSLEDACRGFEKARALSSDVLVERFYPGNDYRLLVVNYRFVAAARRTPAMVTGDGKLKISQLIDVANLDPSRGDDHENALTKINVDSSTEEFLKLQHLSMDDTPASGKNVFLRETANLSTGGTSEDVTDVIHPQIISMAERVARIIGLDICGIDFISEDISQPLKIKRGVVIEVNAAPGFRMHTHPIKGRAREVGGAVVDMLFPQKKNGRIPVIAVTGTNGKTITTRLIAHIARTAGYRVGFTTSDGSYIGNELIDEEDATGPSGSLKILMDRSINFAVLECARTGLLREGLAFDQCEVGIITNVTEDHLGLDGIDTLEEMARLKSVIPGTVKADGLAILNADCPLVCDMKDHLKCKVALFSTNINPSVLDHCKKGGIAAIYKDRKILLIKGNTIFLTESIHHIPLAFGGRALFMIENVLAAVLAAYFKGIDVDTISKGLHSFNPSFENVPGRMNLFPFLKSKIVLDHARNLHALSSIGSWIKKERCSLRVGIITAQGDRRDPDLVNFGKASAEIFDSIIICANANTGGRPQREIIDLLYSGTREVDQNIPVEIIPSESEAIAYALANTVPDCLIVLLSDDIIRSFELIKKYKQKENQLSDVGKYN